MVVTGNAALDVAGLRRGEFGLDAEEADDVDALAGLNVVDRDPRSFDVVNVADGAAVLVQYRASGAPEEDVGQRAELLVVRALVDVADDFPFGARLLSVVVAQRDHDLEVA